MSGLFLAISFGVGTVSFWWTITEMLNNNFDLIGSPVMFSAAIIGFFSGTIFFSIYEIVVSESLLAMNLWFIALTISFFGDCYLMAPICLPNRKEENPIGSGEPGEEPLF